MQAIVCKDQIGWRPNARHLIVFSTDAQYHVAGDGKLAGVYEPNDGRCHMQNEEYSKGLELDYPSVSHLNHVAKENNINLIFAIVSKGSDTVYDVYKTLQQNFENSGVGKLDEESNNVVDLVMDNYNVSLCPKIYTSIILLNVTSGRTWSKGNIQVILSTSLIFFLPPAI